MSIADKLQTIAENEQKVYEAGKKSEYDAFWDEFQQNGNRTHYSLGFAGYGWNENNLKPKYDIKPTVANYMFAGWIPSLNVDLREVIEECGITFDTANCTSFSFFLQYGCPKYIPVIDTRSASSLNNFSVNSSVLGIDKIILKDDGSQTVNNMFTALHPGLKDIVFEGVIGQGFDLSTCPALTIETIRNVISCLKDYSGTGTTQTIKLHANCKALLSDAEKAIITNTKGWTLA